MGILDNLILYESSPNAENAIIINSVRHSLTADKRFSGCRQCSLRTSCLPLFKGMRIKICADLFKMPESHFEIVRK